MNEDKDETISISVQVIVTTRKGKIFRHCQMSSSGRSWALEINKAFGKAKNKIIDQVYPYMMSQEDVIDEGS